MMRKGGFTQIELLVALAIIAIMAGIAVPGYSGWLPRYRLKSAATALFSNMQLARMGSIKDRSDWAIVFDTGANSYRVCSDDGGDGDWQDGDESVEKTVSLTNYKSGIGYGHGNATQNATISGGSLPGDDVDYLNNVVVFNCKGTASGGYVYLDNRKNNITYAVGTRISGVVRLVKWNNSNSNWE
jgi:prepilin-type N-terminal cleavage/methylation domain-containing protein